MERYKICRIFSGTERLGKKTINRKKGLRIRNYEMKQAAGDKHKVYLYYVRTRSHETYGIGLHCVKKI